MMEILGIFVALGSDKCYTNGKNDVKVCQKHKIDNKIANKATENLQLHQYVIKVDI